MAASYLPVVMHQETLEVGVNNGKYGLSIHKKELSELLNYTFNLAKDFQHN
jgi:hypothetical protein